MFVRLKDAWTLGRALLGHANVGYLHETGLDGGKAQELLVIIVDGELD